MKSILKLLLVLDHSEIVSLGSQALERRLPQLVQEHPITLMISNSLATTLFQQREYTAAKKLFRGTLARRIHRRD